MPILGVWFAASLRKKDAKSKNFRRAAMDNIILGNGISLLGAILMACIGLLKKRRQILLAQCVQFGIMGVANYILGGLTGALSAVVSMVRNLICARRSLSLSLKLIFTAVLGFLCVYTNDAGILGLLPLLSCCLYTWFLDIKEERRLKCILILCQAFWVVYDFFLHNYVSFFFDMLTIGTNLIGILSIQEKNPL